MRVNYKDSNVLGFPYLLNITSGLYQIFLDSFFNTLAMFAVAASTAVVQNPWILLVVALGVVVAVITPKRRPWRHFR